MIPTIALILIAAAAILQVVVLLLKTDRRESVSSIVLLVATTLLVVSLVDRSIRISFVAVTNTYESLLFFSAVICAVVAVLGLAVRGVPRLVLFGATMLALVLLAITSSPALPKDAHPPIPALQSLWLVLHVTLSFVGESFFAVSFVSAILCLAARDEEKRKALDRMIYTTVGIGYPIFTAGALIFGAIWAQTAWGSYWSWDPKETWALITWLIYTAYLHTRMIGRLRGRVSAVLAVAGFAATIFTFFGVNYLLPGLHSYG